MKFKIKEQIESVESRNLSQRKEETIMTNQLNAFEKEKRGLEQFYVVKMEKKFVQ